MKFVVQKMATVSLLSSSLFLSKPTSLPSLFLRLPLKRCVSSSIQFRHRYGVLLSATSASAVATESTETPTVAHNDNVEQTQKTSETEKVVLPTNDSSEKLLRIRHTVTFFFPSKLFKKSLLFPGGMNRRLYQNFIFQVIFVCAAVCTCDGYGCSKALPRCKSDNWTVDWKWILLWFWYGSFDW